MIDTAYFLKDPEVIRQMLMDRGLCGDVEPLLALLRGSREQQRVVEALYAQSNQMASRISEEKRAGAVEPAVMAQATALSDHITAEEKKLSALLASLHPALMMIPNLLDPSVPPGQDATSNLQVRTWGTPRHFDTFAPQDHLALGQALQGIDAQRAAMISGSRFVVLRGPIARLHRALGQFMLDHHTRRGYTEIAPPCLVNTAAMEGTGQLPKFSKECFQLTHGGLWLIPTAEVSLTNLVREQCVPEASLPMRFVALTPCFRSEAGAHGQDVRGMIRQHQFDKVELVEVTTPEASDATLERLTQDAESVLQALGLPYRVMLLCRGDTGFASAKTYDLEVWLPTQGYREISSCSNTRDFQARRLKARYQPHLSKKSAWLNTLNGSGVAVGRALVAVLENYQNAEGSITIPEVLRPYMAGETRIAL